MDDLEKQFYLNQVEQRNSILDQLSNISNSGNNNFMFNLFDQKNQFYHDVMNYERGKQNIDAKAIIDIDVRQAKKNINDAVKELDLYLSKFR